MKYLKSLLVVASMLLPMSVWAQPFGKKADPVYINLYYDATGKALYLAQETGDLYACTKGDVGKYVVGVENNVTCVASEEIDNTSSTGTVSFLIQDFLRVYWKHENADASKYQSTTVKLATDIDFGQTLKQEISGWICLENNYTGMDFFGKEFDGNDKTISNVCGVVNAGEWKGGIGLFNSISGGTVKNLKLDNVEFIVLNKTSGIVATVSSDEKDYGPVGGLAAYIENSSVDNISLGYINVSAPFAGGLAGYINNTHITNISMIGDASKIVASNDIVLNKNKADSKMGGFKTVLGGLVGASYSSDFNDINIYPETIKNEAKTDSSILGGVAGLFVYDDETMIENITVGTSDKKDVTIQGDNAGSDTYPPRQSVSRGCRHGCRSIRTAPDSRAYRPVCQ